MNDKNPNYTEIREFTNAKCVKCNCVKEHMKRIGCFIMCNKCVKQEFIEGVDKKTYSKWLKVYNKMY